MTMRVLLIAHHHMDRAAGVSGATIALGNALACLGHEVSYFSFDEAYGRAGGSELSRMLQFPWRVARYLQRNASRFDIVDATTGDAWVWGSTRHRLRRPTLITRSHGLEQVESDELRAQAKSGRLRLSAKYPIYHGGFRLWEVRRSLAVADAQVFLNDADRRYAIEHLGIDPATSVVLPNGIESRLIGLSPPVSRNDERPIALAFIGSWIPRKGRSAITAMASLLQANGVPFTLRLLGTGAAADEVLASFSPDRRVRDLVSVRPHFMPEDLPSLLSDADVILQPSWTEGFGLALVEGMACGLLPVATRPGVAATLVREGENGHLLNASDAIELADVVTKIARDRKTLTKMRIAAHASVQQFRWQTIADKTLDLYQRVRAQRPQFPVP